MNRREWVRPMLTRYVRGMQPASDDPLTHPSIFWRGGVLWVSISATHARPAEPDEYDEWLRGEQLVLPTLDEDLADEANLRALLPRRQ